MYEDGFTFYSPELKPNFNIPLCVQHLDNFMLEKDRVNVPEVGEFLLEKEYDPLLHLEDLMMLDDIRKWNEGNKTTIDDQALPSFTELHSMETNHVFPSLAQNSSHNTSSCLNKNEEFLPNFLDTSSDTFQDLTPLMPGGTTAQTASTSSILSESYSTHSGIGENSSSNSSFTVSSYSSEIVSVNERSSFSPSRCFNISTEEISFENSAKLSKYNKSLVIKHETHQDVRRKNNIASQRSRMTRKEKEREMERRADMLERENETLRIKVKKMEEIAEELKRHLLQNILKR
ncbi:transcription factor VBP-like [Centruroides sculpturatus]|uniref:transcription factor VBP-like n=1 Tax=Centruroides sculpturatus TaxID=218467 RepID=UPI000C6E944C|nr:transcription factor VBP-like [Centruroides sculpturatus]